MEDMVMIIVLVLWGVLGFLGWWIAAAVSGDVNVLEIRAVVATTVLRLCWLGRLVRRRSAPDEIALVRSVRCTVADVSWLWRNRKVIDFRELFVLEVYIDGVQHDQSGRNQWFTSKLHHWKADGSFWRRISMRSWDRVADEDAPDEDA